MDFLFVLISIAMITVLIVVHEFGHFLAAKYYGFQTPVFGIGLPFGPSIDLFNKWGTQFKFYFALIGGFVAIPELGDETDPETIKKYNMDKPMREFPVGPRAVVASGGIVFNILFAFLLAIVMAATIGLPKAVPSNAISAYVGEASVAQKAGLKPGDKIIKVNSREIKTGIDLQEAIKVYSHQEINLIILRPIENDDPKAKVEYKQMNMRVFSPGALGIVLGHQKEYEKFDKNPITWVWEALRFTAKTTLAMVLSVIGIFATLFNKIATIFVPSMESAGVNLGEVKGIVGIIQIISNDIKSNAILLFEFAILLSLNLAVINLLPIPALDGGHLAFMAYEAIAGKKPPEKLQENAVQFGFMFLLGVIALTTFNDVKNWIFG